MLKRLLTRFYTKQNRNIHKLSPKDEFEKYLIKSSADFEDLLKAEISARTVKYFEAKNEQDRLITKGEVFALKLLKDRHLQAKRMETDNKYKNNEQLKLKHWVEFKK